MTKLKAFADNKINVAQMMISVCDRVENTVGKGENACYQHFLLFPQYFQRASFLWSWLCGTKLKKEFQIYSYIFCLRFKWCFCYLLHYLWYTRELFTHSSHALCNQCPYSPTILKNLLCLFLQESNITLADWLNCTI